MNTTERTIRVLLVDDHDVVRMGLKAILANDSRMEVAGEAADGLEAIEQFRILKPDLVLMDLRMPRMGGIEATAKICAEHPSAHVVMLTTFDGDDEIYRALRAGARSYLLKNARAPEFLAALHLVHSGQRYLPKHVSNRIAERTPCSDLTAKELEVLRLLGKGLANREIGEVLGVSENTIKTHLKTIFAKLQVSDRTEALAVALNRGIVQAV